MKVISPDLISGKIVLLRLDLDVPLGKVTGNPSASLRASRLQVIEDFRLKAGLPTLRLCLENADRVIIMGHIGRPGGREVPELSVESIYDWLVEHNDLRSHLSSGKLKLLENLRFEKGEDACDENYAKELASYGDFYVNEAFAAHHKAASTTVLPTLLPHAAGLRFAEEVEKLTEVKENPKRPLVVIIGGVKVEDKLPAIEAMSKIADTVLVGGKIAGEITLRSTAVEHNVILGELDGSGMDISEKTVTEWKPIIKNANMIVWNGPLGQVQSSRQRRGSPEAAKFKVQSLGTERGTYEIAKAIMESGAESIIGGGDTLSVLSKMGFLNKFSFVSTGGGAMLKFLSEGTLPTIEALR